MKHLSIKQCIFLLLFFCSIVCPDLSVISSTVQAASDAEISDFQDSTDCPVTIEDGTSSVFLDHASVTMEHGQLHISLSADSWQALSSALSASSTETSDASVQEAHTPADPVSLDLSDGSYSVELTISGGSGKASVVSPTLLTMENGQAYADITWSSSNYDYMIVAGNTYLNESEEGMASKFHIPVTKLDEKMAVIADTTAMGTPHEVSYTFTFYSASVGSVSQMPQEAAKRVVIMAMIIIVGGGILNHFLHKRKNQ